VRLVRIDRGWQDEVLDDDYRQQRSRVLEERSGAQNAVLRARDNVQRAEMAGGLRDAEEALLRHLEDLKREVTEGFEQAPDLNALRNVIGMLFERVVLLPADHPWVRLQRCASPVLRSRGGYYLIPFLRSDTVVERDELDHAVINKAVLPIPDRKVAPNSPIRN
jgi:hypothetical protein